MQHLTLLPATPAEAVYLPGGRTMDGQDGSPDPTFHLLGRLVQRAPSKVRPTQPPFEAERHDRARLRRAAFELTLGCNSVAAPCVQQVDVQLGYSGTLYQTGNRWCRWDRLGYPVRESRLVGTLQQRRRPDTPMGQRARRG